MSCKFFSISTYDYIRNTCLHWIDELELLCITLGSDCCMMNVIHTNIHRWSNAYASLTLSLLSYYCWCYCYSHYKTAIVTIATVIATIKLSYYCATKYFVAEIYFSGVVELTTQLLRLISILWLPLCRINKFGWNTTLEYCCDPLYLWVIKTIFWRRCRGV